MKQLKPRDKVTQRMTRDGLTLATLPAGALVGTGSPRRAAQVRAARPDIALSGDFIVGFPGETDAEFEDTLSILREAAFAQSFSFKYSPRPGTPAATMDGQIAPEVADERLQRLQAQINAQQLAFNQATVGKRTSVLLEKQGRFDGQLIGRSPWLQSVHILGEGLSIGDIVDVDIVEAGPLSLKGELLMQVAA